MAALRKPEHERERRPALVELVRRPDQESDRRPLDLRLLTRLYRFTRPHARRRNVLFALVVARALQLPALGWLTAALLSGPIAARDGEGIVVGVLAGALLVASTVLVLYFRQRLSLLLGEAVIHDLRGTIVDHLFSLPVAFFHKERVGRIISRLTSDLEAVRVGVKDVVFVSAVQLGSMLFSALLMLLYDWRLFLVVALLVPVLAATIRHFQARLLDAYRRSQESFSRVTATVAESIAGVRVTQSHGRAAHNGQLFRSLVEDHAEYNIAAARRSALLLPLLELNGQLFLALLLTLGGYRVLHGGLSLEVLVQFFFLSGSFFGPIPVLGTQYNQALTAMAGAERVFALLDARPSWAEPAEARPIGPIAGHVQLIKVSFGYEPGRPILHEIELDALPGQTVALLGHTGSGKSSLLGLLAKFYEASAGQVLIDGRDLRLITADSLRRQVGMVQQQNFLFTGTVLENIRVGKPGASDQEIWNAARALDVLDLIEGFARGFETPLGERGSGLSLGQRQIVCFTRAMLADPRLLLLDEATSAMDAVTEMRVQAALARLLSGRTSFVVAHRLSTIERADQLLVLEAGRIVERGTHATLLASDSRYHALYQRYHG